MSVTAEDVLHIAALARLRLSPGEVQRLTAELNGILAHVAVLGEAEAAQGGDSDGLAGGAAPLRPDGAPPDGLALPPSRLAPAWREGFFTVPRLDAMETP